ncbi:MAG: GNAT family N-acetyltransferase [Firmicutes bacterium]|nr:GNAT family N-acetyltransferase [Bacillota bacterium]
MTGREIIKRVDDGANNYIRMFGEAPHMESIDNGVYRIIRPKKGEQGIKFICDVRPERLDKKIIRKIKRLKMPVWWPLQTQKPGDELYMAAFPGEMIAHEKAKFARRAETPEDFARWAASANGGFDVAYACIHPQYHYPLCQRGALRCYFIEVDGQIAATAAIMTDGANASLEFVATEKTHRRQGLASGVCAAAIADAFARGAEIVTLRAGNEGTRELYTSLGFKIYNEALEMSP